jgi:hypothetical protein
VKPQLGHVRMFRNDRTRPNRTDRRNPRVYGGMTNALLVGVTLDEMMYTEGVWQ